MEPVALPGFVCFQGNIKFHKSEQLTPLIFLQSLLTILFKELTS